MVVRACVGDAERQGNYVQEGHVRKLDAAASEVGGSRELQAVAAGFEGFAFQEGFVDAAVGVCGCFHQQLVGAVVESDLHTRRGATVSGVEYVCR